MADGSGAEDRPRAPHQVPATGAAELNKTKVANEQREKELREKIKKMRTSSQSGPGNVEANRT
ncbi:hypothetical protein B0T16DRAFT_452687 [Cercophora newfieldiana]|uniref:Uncharacterized protein n=1 Tax=Cercophora newfieldiana TaxID=92897 RepID=A0AA39YSA2_9PEZI|nr:hypothetical protein B0T16DRAFT_452687 [Cercophora newfieldiana]